MPSDCDPAASAPLSELVAVAERLEDALGHGDPHMDGSSHIAAIRHVEMVVAVTETMRRPITPDRVGAHVRGFQGSSTGDGEDSPWSVPSPWDPHGREGES